MAGRNGGLSIATGDSEEGTISLRPVRQSPRTLKKMKLQRKKQKLAASHAVDSSDERCLAEMDSTLTRLQQWRQGRSADIEQMRRQMAKQVVHRKPKARSGDKIDQQIGRFHKECLDELHTVQERRRNLQAVLRNVKPNNTETPKLNQLTAQEMVLKQRKSHHSDSASEQKLRLTRQSAMADKNTQEEAGSQQSIEGAVELDHKLQGYAKELDDLLHKMDGGDS